MNLLSHGQRQPGARGTPIRVLFVLPSVAKGPTGGFKVIYSYAKQLAIRGHSVAVVHPIDLAPPETAWTRLTRWREKRRLQAAGSFRPDVWYAVDPRVRMVLTQSLHPKHVPEADVVVATAWQTAEWVMRYPPSKGAQLYFVQDYEFYKTADDRTRERMVATYQSGMRTVTCSPLVTRILESHGVEDVARVPIGIDLDVFFREVPIDAPGRDRVIGFPDRAEPFKGTRDAIAALDLVRKEYAHPLRIYSFGGRPATSMPEWVQFHRMPSNETLRTLYNSTAVFILPSHYEGFGLPGAEASACGAALACTDSGGVRDYALPNKTALLSPPADPAALASNVLRLLKDNGLRLTLARQGEANIQSFTWHAAGEAFERLLEGRVARPAKAP